MSDQDKQKRPTGRPKGLGKVPGSGRRKGVANRTRVQVLERIAQECDPIGFLIAVARGLQFEAAAEPGASVRVKMYPTHDQRIDAAKVLARKVLPDTKSVEMSGEGGEPFVLQILPFMAAGNA